MIDRTSLISIGKFQRTHALKGELNAILNIDPTYIEDGKSLIMEMDGIFVPFFAESIREKGKTSYLIKLRGIDDEATAKDFVNKTIHAVKTDALSYIDEENLPIEDDEILGFEIIDSSNGKRIGEIIYIDDSTPNILFEVEDESGEILYIPAAEEFIDKIDEENKKIIMTIPEGLLTLNLKKEK